MAWNAISNNWTSINEKPPSIQKRYHEPHLFVFWLLLWIYFGKYSWKKFKIFFLKINFFFILFYYGLCWTFGGKRHLKKNHIHLQVFLLLKNKHYRIMLYKHTRMAKKLIAKKHIIIVV
jgi:hypothetical protein